MGNDLNLDILDEISAILSKRGQEYGDPTNHFQNVAKAWSAILSEKLSEDLTAEDVVLCLDLLKSIRLAHNPDHRDSRKDKVGYSTLLDHLVIKRNTSHTTE